MFSLTLCSAETTIARAMNAALPETVDAWRMVQARRSFQGSIPLAAMTRLRGSLASAEGAVTFDIEFGKNELGVANVWVRADAELPLMCQRSLEPFVLPVHVDARLGLIESESEEAGLPAGYEPLLVDNSQLRLADVVEDELILALPVVPLKPGVDPVDRVWGADETETSATGSDNPFAVLKEMKASKK
jgi:uncharacterized protein